MLHLGYGWIAIPIKGPLHGAKPFPVPHFILGQGLKQFSDFRGRPLFLGLAVKGFPVLLDPQGRVPGRYGVTGYPETFVIDHR